MLRFYVFILYGSINSIISSPELNGHRCAYSICRHPSSVRRLSTFSNDFSSEAEKQILFIKHLYVGERIIVFLFRSLRTLVAMATYISHKLIKGNFFCLNWDIWRGKNTEIFIE